MVFPFTDAVARKSVNVYGRLIVFSSARCVFINPCQVRQNIFQPLNKCMCVFLLLRDYRVPQASLIPSVELNVVLILSKSREQ